MHRGLLATIGALVVAGWAAAVDIEPTHLLANCVLGWGLLWLSWTDWCRMQLPDALTLPLLALGLAVTWLTEPEALPSHVFGALAGYGVFRSVDLGYRLLRGHSGLGQGDAKLLAAGGAWLGWQALPLTVLIAALIGLGFALIRHLRGTPLTGRTALPFGPAIALAIWIGRLHGFPG